MKNKNHLFGNFFSVFFFAALILSISSCDKLQVDPNPNLGHKGDSPNANRNVTNGEATIINWDNAGYIKCWNSFQCQSSSVGVTDYVYCCTGYWNTEIRNSNDPQGYPGWDFITGEYHYVQLESSPTIRIYVPTGSNLTFQLYKSSNKWYADGSMVEVTSTEYTNSDGFKFKIVGSSTFCNLPD